MTIAQRLRIARRTMQALGVLLFCLAGYGLARPFGRGDRWVQGFLGAAARAFGARVTIVGRPIPRGVLFVANHLSWMDILVLGGATGTAFVSKESVSRWPLVGWLARIGGTIFVRRESRTAARGQADALADALRTGRPAAFFPEGTTGNGVVLAPFRASLFASVAPPPPGIAVQPVAIDYGAAARQIAWIDGESTLANARRLIARPGPLAVTLRFLDPIDPAQRADRKSIARAAEAAIAAALPRDAVLS
nr:lysophospholipid acyltransferase family protein [Sphingomonas bacterium]